jgi:hypothetical protein
MLYGNSGVQWICPVIHRVRTKQLHCSPRLTLLVHSQAPLKLGEDDGSEARASVERSSSVDVVGSQGHGATRSKNVAARIVEAVP